MPERSLSKMLYVMEKRLKLSLDESRASFKHSGLRGDGVEGAFREFLDSRLPRFLTVGTGEIIDTNDGRSAQTDVIIVNSDQPIRSGRDESAVYLIEGTAAIAEVKSHLTTKELNDTIDKGTKFKKLRNYSNPGDTVFSNPADMARFYQCPPHFLVAFETEVATSTLLAKLNSCQWVAPEDGSGMPLPPIDAVFILGKGVAINFVEGGSLTYKYLEGPDAGKKVSGWVWKDTDSVLAEMMLWLNSTMPRVRRFSSIAIPYLIKP